MELLTDLHAKGATILMVTHSDYDASFSKNLYEGWRCFLWKNESKNCRYF
jgi:ABC-type lipoprotein export system ATPase subunit